MKHTIISKLLLISSFALTIGSCDNTEDPDSVITSFEKFPLTTKYTTVVTSEVDEEVIVFKFAFNEAQVNDVVVEVGVGASSTATEEVDFTLSSHEIEVPAFAGQDSVSVEVHILRDDEVEDEDETIYLTFSSQSPSGLVTREIQIATIKDSDEPSNDLQMTLSWSTSVFDPSSGEEIDPDAAVNLIFAITDLGGSPLVITDGSSFEEFEMLAKDWNDGEYLLKAFVNSAIDLGSLETSIEVNLELELFQFGVMATQSTFSDPLNALVGCNHQLNTLGKITKKTTGGVTSYTFEKAETIETVAISLPGFVGPYDCDEPGYKVYDVVFSAGAGSTIVNNNFWDSGLDVNYDLDFDNCTVTIPAQIFDATFIDPSLGNIKIEGSGTFDLYNRMIVDYTVTKVSGGAVLDKNTHTFIKK